MKKRLQLWLHFGTILRDDECEFILRKEVIKRAKSIENIQINKVKATGLALTCVESQAKFWSQIWSCT